MKAMASGPAHSKPITPREPSVSRHGSPPKGSISQSCGFGSSLPSSSSARRPFGFAGFGPGRLLKNAIRLPSGDQRGFVQLSWPRSEFDLLLSRDFRSHQLADCFALFLVDRRLDPDKPSAVG